MANDREELYQFIIKNFDEHDYQRAVRRDEDPEDENSFTNMFPDYEQFKAKQRSSVDGLSPDDLTFVLALKLNILVGGMSIRGMSIFNKLTYNFQNPDGFYFVYGQIILTYLH